MEIQFNLCEWETLVRNILVKGYLQKQEYKKIFWIDTLRFLSEVQEINDDFAISWFIDIQVHNVNPNNLGDENEYFAFECKRLNGSADKNKKYVDEWVSRFVIWKYAKSMPIAGMIGFIQGFQKWKTMNDLIDALKSKISFDFYEIEKDFNYSYRSSHTRTGDLWDIDLYHLFFWFYW